MTAYQFNGELFNAKMKSLDEVPIDELDHNNWWYLHGKLEEIVGYDKAVATNCKSAGYSIPTIHWREMHGNKVISVFDPQIIHAMHINAIIPVEVEGIDEQCIGFFWTTYEHDVYWNDVKYPQWEQRGLVCLMSDKEACKYAFKKFDEKSEIL